MKATELRIGNIVKYKEHFIQIENLVKDEFWTINRGKDWEVIRLSDIEPVPLTAGLLEKCGFEKSEYESHVFEHKGSGLILVYDRGYDEEGRHWHYGDDFEKGNGTSALWKAIDFLHQLQNLYFALTGEELEINLEEK